MDHILLEPKPDAAERFRLREPAIEGGPARGVLDPERSVSAIVLHHPEARYLNV